MSTESGKPWLHIYYEVTDCTDNGWMCIESVTVHYVIDNYDMTVTVEKDFTVTINMNKLPEPVFQPYIDDNLVVAQLSTLFMVVQGFGFLLMYDANGRLYITLEPYYMAKVSRVLWLHIHRTLPQCGPAYAINCLNYESFK